MSLKEAYNMVGYLSTGCFYTYRQHNTRELKRIHSSKIPMCRLGNNNSVIYELNQVCMVGHRA